MRRHPGQVLQAPVPARPRALGLTMENPMALAVEH